MYHELHILLFSSLASSVTFLPSLSYSALEQVISNSPLSDPGEDEIPYDYDEEVDGDLDKLSLLQIYKQHCLVW